MTIEPADLLVFGPHPDDLEIGLGGAIARHAALGFRVGLCDLTAGEMGSNGTPEERLAEAEASRAVLGARWRVNLRWPDRAIGAHPEAVREAASIVRQARPRTVALPYWEDRHPDHVAASLVLADAVFNAGLRRYDAGAPAWKADWVCYYFINVAAEPSFVVDVSAHYPVKRRAFACHASQFSPTGHDTVDGMAESAVQLLTDGARRRGVTDAAVTTARPSHSAASGPVSTTTPLISCPSVMGKGCRVG